MAKKINRNDGYQPLPRKDGGYQPSKQSSVDGKIGNIKGGYIPETNEGNNTSKPPKKP